jgi:aminoglycoside phosphotransferase (APT) family kinase protein
LSELVEIAGLRRFLEERFGPGPAEPTVERLGEGHSNLTFLVCRGGDAWVLRRPPRGEILPGTHQMSREFTVMKAIADAGMPVPVPRPIAMCEDASYIGAPFYLMEHVEGVVVRGAYPPPLDAPEHRRDAGFELVDRLADVHAIDWRAIGLDSVARKPEEFLSRNLRRMQELYDAVRHREVAEVDEAGAWLHAHAPVQRDVTLTHGDYKLDNVILERTPPARIAAIVDWEIAAIGDPLVDLGWLLYFSPDGDGGAPTHRELAERYAVRSQRAIDELRFYTAFAGWKIAIIMEGSNYRFKQGMADDDMFSALDAGVPALARRALEIISAP